jgi:rare lipoprotein A
MSSIRAALAATSLLLLLSGCAETQLAVHAAKQLAQKSVGTAKGEYKIGSAYRINGEWYYPAVNYAYTETGIASWYGKQFHGKRTANGEIFDMNLVSAAHKTLPLPSMVRVTNLRNGRSLNIRVNDRGPFARGRIIDLSRRAAQLLGFERAGTVPIRVEIMAAESRQMVLMTQNNQPTRLAAIPSGKVDVAPLPGSRVATPPKRSITNAGPRQIPVNNANPQASPTLKIGEAVEQARFYVQAGAFVHRDLAIRMKNLLDPVANAQVVEAQVGTRRYYRVRVGPVYTVEDGDQLLDIVIASGYPRARLVID